jgi:hypothetical protein
MPGGPCRIRRSTAENFSKADESPVSGGHRRKISIAPALFWNGNSDLLPAARPSRLPAQLAARVREQINPRLDLPLAAAACSPAGLILLVASSFLFMERMDLRIWALILPAANLLLGPPAALIVIKNFTKEAAYAET